MAAGLKIRWKWDKAADRSEKGGSCKRGMAGCTEVRARAEDRDVKRWARASAPKSVSGSGRGGGWVA
jgi:hypothetical protein